MIVDQRNSFWASVKLSDIACNVRPRVRPQDYPELPFIGMNHVESETVRLLGSVPAGTMKSVAVHFRPDDVLYGRLRPYLNKVIAPEFEGLASAEFIPLTVSDGVVPKFVLYRVNSSDFVSYASHLDEGDRPRVTYDQIGEFALALPPQREQRRIVEAIESYFTRLEDAVATLERVQRNLKRHRASVLKAAVEGRLVPTEAEMARAEGRDYEHASVLLERINAERRHHAKKDPKIIKRSNSPVLPDGWIWTSVDAIGDVLLGRQRAPQFLTGRYARPYLRVANIKDDRINFGDLENMDFAPTHFEKYRLQPGDILVSEGQSPELLGQSAIFRGGIDGLCFQKTLHRFRPVVHGPSSEFAQIVFRAHVKSGLFKSLGSITTNIAHLTLIKFKGAPFPLPPVREQERIVTETHRLLSEIDKAETGVRQQVVRLNRLRQSILKWAFEGRLVDQDPSDEPASVLLERIKAERGASAPIIKRKTNRREGNPTNT